jgi:RNA polymerase subunit RPABC4/transcription elongation factor Spt4
MPGFQLTTLGNAFLYLTAFLGAFLAALWLSLVFWAFRDARKRTEDRIGHLLAALVVALLGPPGLVIYLILRPQLTLDEIYQRSLEEEALLSTIEAGSSCPGCGAHTHSDWQICPNCHTRLRKPCSHCGELMDLTWQVCPHCATSVPGARSQEEGLTPLTESESG